MSITLMQNGSNQPKGNNKETAEQAKLNEYLRDAVALDRLDDAKFDAKMTLYAKEISKDTVNKASDQVRQEMKEFSLKAKLNDRLGADRIEEDMKPYGKVKQYLTEAFAIAAPALCAGFAVSLLNDKAGKVVGGVLAAKNLLKAAVRHAVVSSNEKEAMDVKKYGELKRMDWALKKMKKLKQDMPWIEPAEKDHKKKDGEQSVSPGIVIKKIKLKDEKQSVLPAIKIKKTQVRI